MNKVPKSLLLLQRLEAGVADTAALDEAIADPPLRAAVAALQAIQGSPDYYNSAIYIRLID